MRTEHSSGTAWHGQEPARASRGAREQPPKRATEAWFVYIALCADETFYVGIARDVALRLAAHNAGRGARYTRGRGPLRVLATRRCATKGDALRLELALKRLPRERKSAVAESRTKLASIARAVRERAAAIAAKAVKAAKASKVRT